MIAISISDRLDGIPSSEIRRLFDLASRYEDTVSLGIGEPDFDTPAHIKEYAKQALDMGYTHYTPNCGLKELRDAISAKLKNENGIDADPDRNIMVTVGGNQAFLLIMSSFLRLGDEVLVPSPYFVTHGASVTLAGGKLVEVATDDSSEFRVTAESLERATGERSRCIIINSPHNPTGAILRRKDLEEIADVAIEHDLRIVSDEVYEALIYDGEKHVSIASLNGMSDRVITVNSFSKVYAMTGWRVGYVAADEQLINKMVKFQMYLAACPASMAQYAAAKGLLDPRSRASVERMRSEYERRRDYIYGRLAEMPAFSVVKPRGAFYIFPKIGADSCADDKRFCEDLLVEGRVAAVPGSAFGEAGKGHVRMSYPISMENLEKAMDRVGLFTERRCKS